MKKIIDYTTWAIAAVVASVIASQFDVGNEITGILKSVAHKIVPWVNAVIYS